MAKRDEAKVLPELDPGLDPDSGPKTDPCAELRTALRPRKRPEGGVVDVGDGGALHDAATAGKNNVRRRRQLGPMDLTNDRAET